MKKPMNAEAARKPNILPSAAPTTVALGVDGAEDGAAGGEVCAAVDVAVGGAEFNIVDAGGVVVDDAGGEGNNLATERSLHPVVGVVNLALPFAFPPVSA